MRVQYPKLYNLTHLLALNVLLLPKDLTIIFIHYFVRSDFLKRHVSRLNLFVSKDKLI